MDYGFVKSNLEVGPYAAGECTFKAVYGLLINVDFVQTRGCELSPILTALVFFIESDRNHVN